ncbi:hypothetical protein NDA14_002998 [Ustilago hordei]|uniref:Uncharacterized protein n=1 Tax=Ustilago hordei TaxID=120017 RepID=I2FVN3_USTHO|nr:uncharacterized protein UHO2_04518 [Ustilago hordei]KAJ1595778.1 hypothetical protein NDA14_002998 [Ustilago hordei]CCF50976.1 uncharacterized protein UHOR_06887 [Ustilago hordei]SYW84579.1 uncharacterized protein UHO2_04518 [Ustilago hordei]
MLSHISTGFVIDTFLLQISGFRRETSDIRVVTGHQHSRGCWLQDHARAERPLLARVPCWRQRRLGVECVVVGCQLGEQQVVSKRELLVQAGELALGEEISKGIVNGSHVHQGQGEVVYKTEPVDLKEEALSEGVLRLSRAKPVLDVLVVNMDHHCHGLSPVIGELLESFNDCQSLQKPYIFATVAMRHITREDSHWCCSCTKATEESFATREDLGDKVEKARDVLHVEDASSAALKELLALEEDVHALVFGDANCLGNRVNLDA